MKKDDKHAVSQGETVHRRREFKIVKWAGAFILYDTDEGSHLTMKECSDDDEENMRRLELLKQFAKGYRRGKRQYKR